MFCEFEKSSGIVKTTRIIWLELVQMKYKCKAKSIKEWFSILEN